MITGLDADMLRVNPEGARKKIDRGLEVLKAYQEKQRPRLSEVHVGDAGAVTLYTAELGTELRLGRGAVERRLARFDALRAALGTHAENLAVVHLDASLGRERKDRVVASFFAGRVPPQIDGNAVRSSGFEPDSQVQREGERAGIERHE